LERLLHSADENQKFCTYFKNYVKYQIDLADTLVKNNAKHVKPLSLGYKKKAKEYGAFIHKLSEFDKIYSNNLKTINTKIKTLVDKKLVKFSDTMTKTADKDHKSYIKLMKNYEINQKVTEGHFEEFIRCFRLSEDYVRGHSKEKPTEDLWLLEHKYRKAATE
jgi:hypothetical protein